MEKTLFQKNEIVYKEKSKFVQQGHEAVTPTNFEKT